MKRLQELLSKDFLRMSINPKGNGNCLVGLYNLVKEYITKDFIMVEIGCFEGSSTELFALHCKKVYAIDPFDNVIGEANTHEKSLLIDAEKIFLERMSHYDNVEIIKDCSKNAVNRFKDNSLDFVYIDGNHGYLYILEDTKLWMKKVKPNGIIAGHDFGDLEVIRVIKEIFGNPMATYEDTSWIAHNRS